MDCFLRWSQQPEDGRTKRRHYPNIDRAEMFEQGYVAAKSGHSRGSTVDLTLYHLATGELAPMGGDHDLMDAVSHHGARGITPVEAENRQHLCSHHGGLRLRPLRLRVVALHAEGRAVPRHLLRFPDHVAGLAPLAPSHVRSRLDGPPGSALSSHWLRIVSGVPDHVLRLARWGNRRVRRIALRRWWRWRRRVIVALGIGLVGIPTIFGIFPRLADLWVAWRLVLTAAWMLVGLFGLALAAASDDEVREGIAVAPSGPWSLSIEP